MHILCKENSFAQSFVPLDQGFNNNVRCLLFDSTSNLLYAGGQFTNYGPWNNPQQAISRISKWNGIYWDSLGAGLTGQGLPFLGDMIDYDSNLVVGGTFTSIGGIPLRGIAKWDGQNWQFFADAISSGGTGGVFNFYNYGSDLYIGGSFDSLNGIPAYGMAKFDGSSWQLYPSLGTGAMVASIIIFNNELYVGGNFNLGPGKSDIVKFNGISWESVGGGLSGPISWVNNFKIYQNKLYVAGHMNISSGDPGNGVAIWDGISWSQAGNGLLSGNVYKLHKFQGSLYAGGQFTSAGGIPVNFIAKWDGLNWSPLPGNPIFDNGILCFASYGNKLYIGGGFDMVNNIYMNNITQYDFLSGLDNLESLSMEVQIYPNPNSGNFSIAYSLPQNQLGKLKIYDINSRSIFSQTLIQSSTSQQFNLSSNISSGIYTCVITCGSELVIKKFVLIKE